MTSKFETEVGCRQGGQESPCLFNYYFDFVLKIAAKEIDQVFPDGWGIDLEYNIPHLCTDREQRRSGKMRGIEIIKWILYADDVAVFCKSIHEAERLLSIINKTCLRFGLTISFKKTKTQVFNDPELSLLPSLMSIDNQVVENVQEFTYLGQVLTTKDDGCFTEWRISRANAKFNELRNVLTDTDVHMRTRRKLLEACVQKRLTYGCQAHLPSEVQMRRLEVCWFQILRSMIKGGWARKNTLNDGDEDDFAFIYTNGEIERIIKTTPLRNVIYAQYIKYIAHVCRSQNTFIPKLILFSKPTRPYYRDPWIKIAQLLQVSTDQAKRLTWSKSELNERIRRCFCSTL